MNANGNSGPTASHIVRLIVAMIAGIAVLGTVVSSRNGRWRRFEFPRSRRHKHTRNKQSVHGANKRGETNRPGRVRITDAEARKLMRAPFDWRPAPAPPKSRIHVVSGGLPGLGRRH